MTLTKLEKNLSKKNVYIYGAGLYASILYAYIRCYGLEKNVQGFVVTQKKLNQERFYDKPLYEYGEENFYSNSFFCIAIKNAYDVEQRLINDGIEDYCLLTSSIIKNIKKLIFQKISEKPVQRNKIFFDSFDGKGYGCNPKYIAQYLLEMHCDLDLVWDVVDGDDTELPTEINKVVRFSYEYYLAEYTSGIIISNCSIDSDLYRCKRKEQYLIQTWHGSGSYKKAGADMFEGDKNAIEELRKSYSIVDLCVSNTAGNTQMFRQAFFYKGEIAEYGSPRVDIIFHNEGVGEKIRKRLKIPKNKKILLYAPTFRDTVDDSFSYYDLDMERILEQLAKRFGGEYVLIYRFHQKLYQYGEGKNYYPYGKNITMYHDVMEFLVASDVLITDYSSIMWDFGLQRRPIFLYQNDAKQYTDDRGFYKPISTWPYPIAHTQEELLENIQKFDEQDYLNKLEAFIAADPSYDDGHATERVVARMMDVIEHPEKYGKE